MSYIQCKSVEEVEDVLEKSKGIGFVTKDQRVYSEIQFSDGEVFHKIDPKEMQNFLDFKGHVEMLEYDMCEMSFLTIVDQAKALAKEFKKVQGFFKPKKKT